MNNKKQCLRANKIMKKTPFIAWLISSGLQCRLNLFPVSFASLSLPAAQCVRRLP